MSGTLVKDRDNPLSNLVVPYAFMDKYPALIQQMGCNVESRIDDPTNDCIYFKFKDDDWFEIDRMTMEPFEDLGIAYSIYSTAWNQNSKKLAKTDTVAAHLRFDDTGEADFLLLEKDYERVDVEPLVDLALQGRTHELEQAVLKAGAICTVPSFEDQDTNGKIARMGSLVGLHGQPDDDEDDDDDD